MKERRKVDDGIFRFQIIHKNIFYIIINCIIIRESFLFLKRETSLSLYREYSRIFIRIFL